MRYLRVLTLAALALMPVQPRAQPADAEALRGALQAWMTTWTGGLLPTLPAISARPDGEAVLLELPFGGNLPDAAVTLSPGALTARVHPLDAGRWAIDDLQAPPSVTLTIPAPGPAQPPGRATTTLSFGKQTVSGVFDPTLASESHLDATIDGYSVAIANPASSSNSHIDRLTSHNRWTPSGPDRVSMTSDSELSGYTMHGTNPAPRGGKPMPFTLSMQRIRTRGLADDVDFAAFRRGLVALFALAHENGGGKPTSAQMERVRTMIAAFAETLGGLDSEQEWQGVAFTSNGQSGSLRRVALGVSMHAADGKFQTRLPLALEGFESKAITDPALRDLLPRSLSLTPRLAGLSVPALRAALDRLAQAGDTKPDMMAETLGILAASPVDLAIDDLAFDIGPMRVTGTGSLSITAPDDTQGTAELRATGLDDLLRRARGQPALKQAVPFLIFLKGIAEPEGDAEVWKLTWQDGALSVNGTELSDLAIPGK